MASGGDRLHGQVDSPKKWVSDEWPNLLASYVNLGYTNQGEMAKNNCPHIANKYRWLIARMLHSLLVSWSVTWANVSSNIDQPDGLHFEKLVPQAILT